MNYPPPPPDDDPGYYAVDPATLHEWDDGGCILFLIALVIVFVAGVMIGLLL